MGKTEIARRLARLAHAPFIKVEATKFTEVGYVGRDVDTIIRDLVETAVKDERELALKQVRDRALDAAENHVLDILLTGGTRRIFQCGRGRRRKNRRHVRNSERSCARGCSMTRRSMLMSRCPVASMEILAPPGMEDLTQQIQGMFQNFGGGKKRTRRLRIADAMRVLADEEAARLVNDEEVKMMAVQNVEQKRHCLSRRDGQDRLA